MRGANCARSGGIEFHKHHTESKWHKLIWEGKGEQLRCGWNQLNARKRQQNWKQDEKELEATDITLIQWNMRGRAVDIKVQISEWLRILENAWTVIFIVNRELQGGKRRKYCERPLQTQPLQHGLVRNDPTEAGGRLFGCILS